VLEPERPVPVERVTGHVHAGQHIAGGTPDVDEPAAVAEWLEPSPPMRPPGPRELVGILAHEAVPAGALAALLLATRDPALTILSGGAVYTARFLHAVAGNVRFGFGDGFLAFRSQMSWPRGVQEDDDFHWSWPSGGAPAPRVGRWADDRARLRQNTAPPTH
jgi:hypothetical protein